MPTSLFHFGLSGEEVASALGVSHGGARQLQRRALKALEAHLVATREGSLRTRRLRMERRIKPHPVLAARRFAIWSAAGAVPGRRF